MSRKDKGRGMRSLSLLLVGAVAGAMMLTPAFAGPNDPVTNKKFKKVVKKLKNKDKGLQGQITTLGANVYTKTEADAKFESGDTIKLLGSQVKMNFGDPEKTLQTIGPFTFKTTCTDSGAGVPEGTIWVTTTEANSSFWSNWWGSEADFDPADPDGPVFWIQDTASNATDAYNPGGGHNMRATAPGGTSLSGLATMILNFAGAKCVFTGFIVQH